MSFQKYTGLLLNEGSRLEPNVLHTSFEVCHASRQMPLLPKGLTLGEEAIRGWYRSAATGEKALQVLDNTGRKSGLKCIAA